MQRPILSQRSQDSSKDLEEIRALSHVYDAHSHVHLDRTEAGQSAMDHLLNHLGGVALMSTGDNDWERVITIDKRSSRTRCLLGVHPWFAHRYVGDQSWLVDLERHLLSTSGSAIGEIGLDKQWRTPDTGRVEYAAQREVFHAQLILAAQLNLPISVHCVRAQGDLYQALTSAPQLPPTIYLHAFGGARGTVEQLVRSKLFGDRIYFGFAACINLRSPKTRDVISAVPDDRLVIESDRSSALRAGSVEADLIKMLRLYTEVKNWGECLEEAAQRTALNAQRLYAPADHMNR